MDGDHTRMGGEKVVESTLNVYCWGSPPRWRGKGDPGMYDLRWMGITPAWAGKRIAGTQQKKTAMDHPRVGGEKLSCKPLNLPVLGSPPHGRGKVGAEIDRLHKARITPAWAGKRSGASPRRSTTGDHPRVGGEKFSYALPLLGGVGSPPRGRGKDEDGSMAEPLEGITPA